MSSGKEKLHNQFMRLPKMMRNSEILRLAVPSIISNITVPLLGLVDVTITGHMGNASYMAAIAVGSMVFNIMYWLFSFLRFGTGGMTAQAYGKADIGIGEGRYHECFHILLRALLTCFLLSAFMIIMQVPIFMLIMWFISPGESLDPIVRTYYNICIWGTFPSLAMYAMTGWYVGMQNTVLPMIVSITQNVVNILLSCFFVYVLQMKIEGIAMGTLLAQWSGLLIALACLCYKYRALWRGICLRGAIKLREMRRFFSVNSVLFYRTLFLVAVNLYFIVAGAKGGENILSVNSILMQMFILYTYVMDGFAFAAEALCGRYYGAADKQGFNYAFKGVWRWAIALTAVYTLLYAFGGEAFMSMLTDDEEIRQLSKNYLPWAIIIPVCGVAAFVWDGVFVGLTETKGMLWGTFCGATSFFVLYFLLCPYLANHALWIAFNAYLLMRGIAQHLFYYVVKKQ